MMWLIQLILAQLWTAKGINLAFVLLNIAAAFGLSPRLVAVASSLLYLAMVFQ